jgi:hypothetical protein
MPWMIVLVSAVVTVASYLQAFNYPFVYDDVGYIVQNFKLAGLGWPELWRLFSQPYNPAFEFLPLRELSYWMDLTLFGLNPSAFRLHSILLYLLCLPLVYAITSNLWRYFRPADGVSVCWAAAAVTALFALHPSHAEAVVWIAGRKDVLSTLFSLLALWFAINARRESGLSAPYAAAALVALLAAILSKATAVVIAPIMVMLWVMFWRDMPASRKRYSVLLWCLASMLLAACLAVIFTGFTTQKIPLYFGIEAVTRTLAILGWLVRLSISPESRHFFYPVLEDAYLPAMVGLGIAVLAGTAAGALMMLRKCTLERFSVVVFLLLCIPSLQLIPYAPPSLVSDRWLALAVWPVILLIVVILWRLPPLPRTIVLLVIALSWGFQSAERTRDWRSFEALLDSDLHAYPGYYMPAMYKIIFVQLPQGLYRDANETSSGIINPEFRAIMNGIIQADHAVRVNAINTGKPQEAMNLLWDLGVTFKQPPAEASWNPPIHNMWGKGRTLIKGEWEYLAQHFADDASVHYNAGLWMLEDHKIKDAVVHLRIATESQRLPDSERGTAYKNFGLALLESGQVAAAEVPLRAALEQSPPDFRAYCLLTIVYKRAGRKEEAARTNASCPSNTTNQNTVQ